MKIVFVVNEAWYFSSHRLNLALEAAKRGHDVCVVCREDSQEEAIESAGLKTHTIPLTRSSMNPLREWRTFRAIIAAFRELKPDLVHQTTIKPVLYGTIAARWCGVRCVVNAVAGQGYMLSGRGPLGYVRRKLTLLGFRAAWRHQNMMAIFQNKQDQLVFVSRGLVSEQRARLIHGSGVDLKRFAYAPEANHEVTFLLVGRMLKDKGVREFVRAAKELRKDRPNWQFVLVGAPDFGNPTTLTTAELETWHHDGVVRWLGSRTDVPELMRNASVVVLPSYHEGVPKSLLEAAACGRAMIASDIPGCREVVTDQENGLLVPVRQWKPLADAMRTLGDQPAMRQQFGNAAHRLAQEVFSVQQVAMQTMAIYAELAEEAGIAPVGH